jgi:peptidoglycan/xylan/chitin deacetylase (PgdA/CDA1 family)
VSADGPPRGAKRPPGGSAAAQPQAWGDHASDGWRPLDDELDAWKSRGIRATLWLRDDDACADSPALRRLLGLAREYRIPVAVAAIPAAADRTLVDAIARCEEATVVQHGYAHRNHARPGERSAELGDGRELAVRLDELARGRERLARTYGDRFIPLLVPPWNRIAEDLLPHLAAAGFAGVSRFGPRATRRPAADLREVNAHVDPIAWRRDRQFIGGDGTIGRLVAHLRARRERTCDADEPTGLLTHHLAFGDTAWDFLDALLARTSRDDAVAWLDAARSLDAPAEPLTSCRSA